MQDLNPVTNSATRFIRSPHATAHSSRTSPVNVGVATPAPPDTSARWSGHGQVGIHWTEGTKDVVMLMAQHDLTFLAAPYEVYVSLSGAGTWTDILDAGTGDPKETRTQRVYRYGLDVHGQRALSNRAHAVATVVWLSDPNQGIDIQLYAGTGATLTLNKGHGGYRLRAQASGGYLREREVSGERLDAPALSVALHATLRFAAGGRLSLYAEAIDNLLEPEDLLIRFRGSLTAPLGDRFGLTVSANLSHDLLPAAPYFEDRATGTLVRIEPDRFSALVTTGLSVHW